MRCIFCNLCLELAFGVALESLVGSVWAQQVPRWKSWGVYLAVHFSELALELFFEVALEVLVGVAWARDGPKLGLRV